MELFDSMPEAAPHVNGGGTPVESLSPIVASAENPPRRVKKVAPIYRQIMLEIERRRHQLGCPMWKVDEASGVEDGYFAKMQAMDAKTGRQAGWDILQLVIDALFPQGVEVSLKPKDGGPLTALEYRRLLRVSAEAHGRPHGRGSERTNGTRPQQPAMNGAKAAKSAGGPAIWWCVVPST